MQKQKKPDRLNNEELSLAVLQADLIWEDPQANLAYFDKQISELDKEVELVVLPETFTTGFTMDAEEQADRDEITLNWMRKKASEHKICICGSAIIAEGGNIYNRMYWIPPTGEEAIYDKRHLFRIGGEKDQFTPGKQRKIVSYKGFRILLQICYDLRFPVFSRNRGDYDMIIYVANWPSARTSVWDALLPARAIENQAWVVGANRCGSEGDGAGTCGNSAIIDFKGRKKAWLEDKPGCITSTFILSELVEFKLKFPAHEDADQFSIEGIL